MFRSVLKEMKRIIKNLKQSPRKLKNPQWVNIITKY